MSLQGKTVFATDIATGTSGDRQGDRGHATIHNNIGSVLNNLQDDVGVDNSADTASLKYKVENTANANRIKSKDVATPSVNGQYLKYNSSTDDLEWDTPAGGGDMSSAQYDPANISEQLVGLTATQTLTNKRLTSPKINENVAVTATATELNYSVGVTSAIQTQLNNKQAIVSGVSDTEIGYLDGVTSAIQTQLNAKAPIASPTFTGTVTLPVGLTGVIRADSGVVSTDSDVTDLVSAASTTLAGKVELATSAETTTGTDATRAVTPDGLAGSDYGKRIVEFIVLDNLTNTSVGDGAGNVFFIVPSELNGYNLVNAQGAVFTAGTTNTTDIQIHNVTDAVDMLSTKITIDSTETTSYTAATPPVINTSNDDVATGDKLRFDVDAISTTPAKGLVVIMTFQLP